MKIRLYLCLLLASCGASAATVNCTGTSGDASTIQSAVNGGGTVAISGSCSITSQINVNNAVTISGPATLTASPTSISIFNLSSDNVTFHGLTFVAGGIFAGGGNAAKRSHITITNNTFRDWTGGETHAGIECDEIMVGWTISGNTFSNFWSGGFSSAVSNPGNTGWVAGIVTFGGLDNTTISNNTFDQFEDDSMHFFNQGLGANSGGYTASGVVLANNTFVRQHRMGIEYNDYSSPGACPGGCRSGALNTGTVIKNNYFHLPAWPWPGVFAWSITTWNSNARYYNNTAIVESIVGTQAGGNFLGFAWELGPSETNLFLQANIVAETFGSNQKWGSAVANYPPGSATNNYQNNLFCGYFNGTVINTNATGGGANTQTANIATSSGSCPGAVSTATSSMALAFTSPNNQSLASGATGTWNVSAASNLTINNVQFFVDSSSVPVITQEIQDVNSNFPSNHAWLYHASFSTAGIAGGTHTLTAKASDISGTTQTASQTFSISGGGSASTPTIASFASNPATISAGASSTLSWNVTGMLTSLSIDQGIGSVAGLTSISVSPMQTTTYKLTACSVSGCSSATTTVTVSGTGTGTPTINSFSASPTTINASSSSTLSWSVTGATSLSINQGVGPQTGASVVVTPPQTTIYTLTALNTAGSSTAVVTVTVTIGASSGTAGSGSWPTVATTQNLFTASDHAHGSLAAATTFNALSISLTAPGGFVQYQVATMGSEQEEICAVSGSTLTFCSRSGLAGTTPTTHGTGALVSGYVNAIYKNRLNKEYEAMESYSYSHPYGHPGGSSAGTAAWPNHAATDADLFVATDGAQAHLTSSITNSGLSLAVDSTTYFVANQIALIDSELVKICAASGLTITICSSGRGLDGTTALAHSNGATIRGTVAALDYKQLATEGAAFYADLFSTHTGSTATPLCSHSVSLSWTASPSSGVTSYNVYRSTGYGSTPNTKIASATAPATAYTDSTMACGGIYEYAVTAVSSGGESSKSNVATAPVPSWPHHAATFNELFPVLGSGSVDAILHNRQVAEILAWEQDVHSHP